MRDRFIAVPRPVLHLRGEQLHCEEGPAVHWPNGTAYHFLNGVRVPSWLVETSADRIDAKQVLDLDNEEVKREAIRKVGVERLLSQLNPRVVDSEPGGSEYTLIEADFGGIVRRYLKMLNPSIGVYHVEAVHPECYTVQQALNFRNGLTPMMIDDVNGSEWFQQGDVILRPRGETKFKSRPTVLT
jgi:hypothetical protein